jgi:hypothetical protein
VSGHQLLTPFPARVVAQLAALAAAAQLAFVGCGGEHAGSDAAPSPGAAATSPAATGAPLRFEDGRVSVARDQVLQLAVLEELAARAGFALEVGAVAPRSLTLQLDAVPLLDALSVILEGADFQLQYAVDPATGAHRLARLRVGEPRAVAAAPPPAAAGASAPPPAERGPRGADKLRGMFGSRSREEVDELAREAAASAEQRRTREAAALEQLTNADPERRAEAIASIDPAGDAAAQIGEVARTDPDPRVRAAAVERLGDADTYEATSLLLESLSDPSPQVVVAAIEALEYVGDASLLPRIEALAGHANADVREAVQEASESLR